MNIFYIVYVLIRGTIKERKAIAKIYSEPQPITDEFKEFVHEITRKSYDELVNESRRHADTLRENKPFQNLYNRSEAEINLKNKFSRVNSRFIEEMDDQMYGIAGITSAYRDMSLAGCTNDQLVEISKHIDLAFNICGKYKKICYKKGKGGKLYFQDMWIHLHDSEKNNHSWERDVGKTYLWFMEEIRRRHDAPEYDTASK